MYLDTNSTMHETFSTRYLNNEIHFHIFLTLFIFYISFAIVIKNGKIVWKHGLRWCISGWTWNIGVVAQSVYQNSVLATFGLLWPCCQRFWGSSEDDYRSKQFAIFKLLCYCFEETIWFDLRPRLQVVQCRV